MPSVGSYDYREGRKNGDRMHLLSAPEPGTVFRLHGRLNIVTEVNSLKLWFVTLDGENVSDWCYLHWWMEHPVSHSDAIEVV